MSNPKDPQVRREEGGPYVPIDDAGFDLQPELPVDRFRRLGAPDDTVAYLQEVWDSLDDMSRAEWVAELDVSTDAELVDELGFEVAERPDDAEPGVQEDGSVDADGEPLPPPVEGRVEHEGGGWYSVWIGGDNVTGDDTVRGRDTAEALLQEKLAERSGPIDEG